MQLQTTSSNDSGACALTAVVSSSSELCENRGTWTTDASAEEDFGCKISELKGYSRRNGRVLGVFFIFGYIL